LEKHIRDLKTRLEAKIKEVIDLSIYKNAYDEVHYAFSPSADDGSNAQKKVVNTTRKNQIVSDIINAKRIEEQVLTLINISTEGNSYFRKFS
jgi:hypothetical protein